MRLLFLETLSASYLVESGLIGLHNGKLGQLLLVVEAILFFLKFCLVCSKRANRVATRSVHTDTLTTTLERWRNDAFEPSFLTSHVGRHFETSREDTIRKSDAFLDFTMFYRRHSRSLTCL